MRGLTRRTEPKISDTTADRSGVFEKYYPALEISDRWIGSVIQDRYLVLQRLGNGGFGAVYLATDKKNDKLVAIKLLGSYSVQESASGNGLIDMSDYFRFAREARASNMIDHPNVVKIHDTGVFNGTPFIVMEYLKGTDLKGEITTQKHISWERARGIILQVCDGLQALHKNGIIHRDIKPSNIFLAQEKNREVAKLIDFGLVKFTANSVNPNLTDSDEIVGTPAYMAPEMLDSSIQCDHRLDIYSLGATIYEMLVGQPPFNARNYVELMLMHRDRMPRPLIEARPEIVVPKGLENILMKALQKRPEDRYQNVEELKEAIDSLPRNAEPTLHEPKGFINNLMAFFKSLASLSKGFGDFSVSFKPEDFDLYKKR